MARISALAVTRALEACVANRLAADLLARLRAPGAERTPAKATRPFPRRTACAIYREKALKGDRGRVRTDGFPELLTTLEAAEDGQVIVHGIAFPDAVYLVLTDAGRTECLGVLRKRRLDR